MLRPGVSALVRSDLNRMSRTFQARAPLLVMVGVLEICGRELGVGFASFANALFCLLMSTLRRVVRIPKARILTVLHNLM